MNTYPLSCFAMLVFLFRSPLQVTRTVHSSSGTTNEAQLFSFDGDVKAKAVFIVGYGNSITPWNRCLLCSRHDLRVNRSCGSITNRDDVCLSQTLTTLIGNTRAI